MPGKEGKFVLGSNRGPLLTSNAENQFSASELEKIESAGGLSLHKVPTRKEKLQRHWKRFWLFYCIGNVIFLAIFLPILFLVCIPAIAQMVVNKADLRIVNADVMQPNPDSVMLTLQSKVDLKLALPARIEPLDFHLFIRQDGFGPNYPYADLPIPGQTIRGNYTLGVKDNFTPLLNQTTWKEFVREIVFQKETTLSLKGVTNAYLGVLKSHVTLNKDVTVAALNQFSGLSISDATLLLPAKSDGTNLIGNITLPNPTVFTLQVGTLNLDLLSGDLPIGNVTITDVTLKPGDNTYPLNGVLDLKKVIENLGEVLKSQASLLKTGNLTLIAKTTSIHWNNTYVPYYSDVLRTLSLTTAVGVGDIVKNTLKSFLNGKNLTGLLSSISTRSLDGRDLNGPVEIATLMKHDKSIQDAFEDISTERRDNIIDSLMAMYPTL
ncbi:hypothetical protein N7448_002747 [Penicillium atrosanguineum]|uniref:uncharacterized protein n=1 Tax=Penicillium atrosanguineum TaxID=1132637 RepID=UPI002397BF96|nr:uncharacterized protein N7443_006152 [Penicillium atrosanguineum]KAJ5145355.1 hypothetical protein N7448_002747 [Penicillium atrosanguineum]KAJ5301150.1 hypothetical protein N7443_006152 [Penicillium atrosanguineum]